jgi:hypothetical protein
MSFLYRLDEAMPAASRYWHKELAAMAKLARGGKGDVATRPEERPLGKRGRKASSTGGGGRCK